MGAMLEALHALQDVELQIVDIRRQLQSKERSVQRQAAKLKGAQALRQSILRHAFTGQLVPQDPKDEPAAELLRRIAAEREARARQALAARSGMKWSCGAPLPLPKGEARLELCSPGAAGFRRQRGIR